MSNLNQWQHFIKRMGVVALGATVLMLARFSTTHPSAATRPASARSPTSPPSPAGDKEYIADLTQLSLQELMTINVEAPGPAHVAAPDQIGGPHDSTGGATR
jgi:hypothetical protein